MTEKEAYAATFIFIEEMWKRNKSEDLAIILGDMSLLEDGSSADPAIMLDWKAALNRALQGEGAGDLTLS